MRWVFYIAGAVAVISTFMTITRLKAVHALLYLIVSLLAIAMVFYTMGAPVMAALEVIIYAGAIMVVFLFVVMMLNLGERAVEAERKWQKGNNWIGPATLTGILMAEMIYLLTRAEIPGLGAGGVGPKEIGMALYGRYAVGVELASMLLLVALVGACHLGRRRPQKTEANHDMAAHKRRDDSGGTLVHAGAGRPIDAP
jgi:NADH-quinone oxidoreductase subunit J